MLVGTPRVYRRYQPVSSTILPRLRAGGSKEGIVPLSEHEQRLLDEIEQALYAEDPKFASSVRSARRHRRSR